MHGILQVQEARARKKLREKRRLQKVKSQAAAVAESTEFTESAKARAIEKIARKARRGKSLPTLGRHRPLYKFTSGLLRLAAYAGQCLLPRVA